MMTNKEAIEILENEKNEHINNKGVVYVTRTEAVDRAIKALEQKPCKDAINREVACKVLTKARMINDSRPMEEIFAEIPSVTPKEKVGHWITRPYIYGVVFCSECGFELRIDDTKYCPNCGARMESEEV